MNNSTKTYILYDNMNNMWNNGHIYVYINDKIVESIFVDEYEEANEGMYAEDIIEMLQQKYTISKVVRKEHNWR